MAIRFLLICLFAHNAAGLFSQSNTLETETLFSAEVYFDFGKQDLRPDAAPTLSEINQYLSDKKNLQIKITAHTDSIGSITNNQALSDRRSASIKAALVEMGVPDSLFTVDTFGETMPVASNQTEEGRQLNRRATIEIVKQKPLKASPEILTNKEITELTGRVIDKMEGHGLEAMVVVRGKGFRDTLYTDTSGFFTKKLPVGIVVGIDAFSDCHFFGSEMTKTEIDPVHLDLPLLLIQTGAALDLNNLYFVGNQPILLEKSKPEMPKILRFMQANPKMKIEVAGHINLPNLPPVDINTWHFKLSHDRAKTVYDYLVENGIPSERISFKGYGNWEMRFPHAVSEQQQALNRRVELRVVEGGCE